MRNRLHVKSLLSIGAVEAGDNPEADILFWKRNPPTEPREGLIDKEGDSMDAIESLDAANARISELETKLAAYDVETPASLPDDLPDAVAKRLDEQDAAIAKAEAEKVELAKKLAQIEDERATEKYMKIAEAYAPYFGPAEEMAPVFKALGTSDADAFAKLEATFETLAEKAGFAQLLKEYGDSSAEGSATDQIALYATKIREADPTLSVAKARAQAWTEHPELKALSREEA